MHQCHNSFASVKSETLEGQQLQQVTIQNVHRQLDTIFCIFSFYLQLQDYSASVSVNTLLLTTNGKHFVLGSSCDNQKETLHAVYITIICLLLISNLILIFFVCRMRTLSGKWAFILKALVLFLYFNSLLNSPW